MPAHCGVRQACPSHTRSPFSPPSRWDLEALPSHRLVAVACDVPSFVRLLDGVDTWPLRNLIRMRPCGRRAVLLETLLVDDVGDVGKMRRIGSVRGLFLVRLLNLDARSVLQQPARRFRRLDRRIDLVGLAATIRSAPFLVF